MGDNLGITMAVSRSLAAGVTLPVFFGALAVCGLGVSARPMPQAGQPAPGHAADGQGVGAPNAGAAAHAPTYAITVKVLDEGRGQQRYFVWLFPSELSALRNANAPGFGDSDSIITPPGGDAVFRAVPAGTYTIQVHPAREVRETPGPTIRLPDGSIQTIEHHGWTQDGSIGGSAVVTVVDHDVSIAVPFSTFLPSALVAASPAQPAPQAASAAPATADLIPGGAGARGGHITITNTGQALRIEGELDGSTPDWPQNSSGILAKDHVEVWLAGPADVELPPIGWGHQFGAHELASAQSCAEADQGRILPNPAESEKKCRDWYARQEKYRPLFSRLFVRQWLLAPGVAEEAFATPAYQLVAAKYAGKRLAELEPRGAVNFHAETHPGKPGYTFQIDIPYSSFPPLNTLDLREVRLMVDVFSAAPAGKRDGPFSSTSSTREFGKPATFNRLRLDPPRVFALAPCQERLQGDDIYGYPQPAWFIPKADAGQAFQADAFLVVNEVHGYQYEPGDTISPTLRPIHFFWHAISPDEWVCGPQLAYRQGTIVRNFGPEVSDQGFDARRTPEGKLLIKSGPQAWWSEFGSGQCGACPHMRLQILELDANLNLIVLLNLDDTVGGLSPFASSGDVTITPDWSRVVEYGLDENDVWTSVEHCYTGATYQECGRKTDVKPPSPPVIRNKLEGYSGQ